MGKHMLTYNHKLLNEKEDTLLKVCPLLLTKQLGYLTSFNVKKIEGHHYNESFKEKTAISKVARMSQFSFTMMIVLCTSVFDNLTSIIFGCCCVIPTDELCTFKSADDFKE